MIKPAPTILYFYLLFLILVVSGCAGLEKKYPERDYYILSAPNNRPDSALASDSGLEVRRFKISPGFSSREFVYRKGETRYVSDFYNQFFSSPVLIVTEVARDWLLKSGLFKHVVDSNSAVESDYVLEGNITELYGDYRVSNSPSAVLAIQFLLLDETTINRQISFQDNYRREIPLPSGSPEDLVEGWNKALEEILSDFQADLKRADLRKKVS